MTQAEYEELLRTTRGYTGFVSPPTTPTVAAPVGLAYGNMLPSMGGNFDAPNPLSTPGGVTATGRSNPLAFDYAVGKLAGGISPFAANPAPQPAAPASAPAPAPEAISSPVSSGSAMADSDVSGRSFGGDYGGDAYGGSYQFAIGGLVGPGGENMNMYTPSTVSLDLPPSLSNMFGSGNMQPQAPVGLSGPMTGQSSFIPKYEMGGMVTPQGAPPPQQVGVNPSMQAGAPMDPQMMEAQINQFATQHPQQVAQIRQAIMQVMQSGELTQPELNMIVQLATVASQNPEMYPNVRKFAIQQGIATEQDLPQQYDQGLVFVLLLAAKAIQQDIGGQNMIQGGSPAQAGNAAPTSLPSMASGGTVPNSKKRSGGVIIEAHEGEYVIPKHIVQAKGTDFFDKLIGKDEMHSENDVD